jgi:hypothetical protein
VAKTVTTTQSVELRLKRAERHFQELQGLVTSYVTSDPYTVVRRMVGKEHIYELEFTSQPDEQIAVVAGDFFHNVRSALNYLMTGLVPSNRQAKTQFPIFDRDPFRRDPVTHKYVERDPNQRNVWKQFVKGIDPRALAYIRGLQPYARETGPNSVNMLATLNRLSNADKHRHLAIVPQILEFPEKTIDGSFTQPLGFRFVRHGTEVHRSPTTVNVEVEGTIVVLLRIGRAADQPEISAGSLLDLLVWVRAMVVEILRPYLRR